MSQVIAITGKGGTGKTALAALLVRHLIKNRKSLLVIDADADTNLPGALGVTAEKTVGEMKEFMFEQRDKMSPDTDKERVLESKIYEVLTETKHYDLLVMGRPEGAGCYCFANNLLRGIMDRLIKNYDITIIDTAAGLEHLSRRLIRDVDTMVVVTDGSRRGLQTAERIRDLAGKLSLNVKRMYVAANKVTDENRETIKRYAAELKLELIGAIPFDAGLARLDMEGTPLVQLGDDSPAVKETGVIAKRIGL
ncbi:MAG TPA: AAA family ATPase [Candidatus Methanoperedenaceae archaeon]|nr:AAA family ATPase [Candidatus Methanoperedenaceae archaeon]